MDLTRLFDFGVIKAGFEIGIVSRIERLRFGVEVEFEMIGVIDSFGVVGIEGGDGDATKFLGFLLFVSCSSSSISIRIYKH